MCDNSTSLLHVEDVGHGDPIVLLHGFGVNSYSWRHIIPVLLKKYRTIAIDLKGFGRSEKPYDDKYSVYDQAQLVCDLIKRFDLHNIVLIGHSYGGGVALATTLFLDDQHSLRLKRLVLIDSVAYKQHLPLFIKVMRTPLLGRLGLSLLSPEAHVKSVLELCYYDDSRIAQESISEYAKPLHTPEGRYAILKVAAQIVPPDITHFSSRYQSIIIPVLILWGDADRIVPISVGKKLHKNLENSRFHVISECGHMPHEEKPDVTISLISAFLGEW